MTGGWGVNGLLDAGLLRVNVRVVHVMVWI